MTHSGSSEIAFSKNPIGFTTPPEPLKRYLRCHPTSRGVGFTLRMSPPKMFSGKLERLDPSIFLGPFVAVCILPQAS